jgi:hypothetical protein
VEYIYLGPLGRLMKIDVPTGGFTAELVENGVIHTPLSGRPTKDIFSRRRTYKIGMDGLAPNALSWLEMLYTDAVTGPFYLLDTARRNRLRARISSTGSAPISLNASSVDWANPGAGALTYPAAAVTLLPSGINLLPAPSKALQWVPGAANVLTDSALIPVIPGRSVTFSVYAQVGSPTLEIVPINAALVAQPPITGTVVIAGTPTRGYVTYTPPSTIVAVQVQIRASVAGTYTTLAWQLNDGVLPTDWVLGTGVPQVMFPAMDATRQPVGNYTASTLTLLEV